MADAEVIVRIADIDEVKTLLSDLGEAVKKLEDDLAEARREAIYWEEQYEWLLGEVGGVSPR